MLVNFYLRYSTSFGQSLYITGNNEKLGKNIIEKAVPLTFLNREFWMVSIDFETSVHSILAYKFVLKDKDGILIIEGEKERSLRLNHEDMTIVDTWNHAGSEKNSFFTQPFKEVLLSSAKGNVKFHSPDAGYFEFRVKAPLLDKNEQICILGEGAELNNWETNRPLLLSYDGSWHVIRISIPLNAKDFKYKYGLYDQKLKTFKQFESGNDRSFQMSVFERSKTIIIHDSFVNIERKWKGAGVAIPVFSIRSKDSFGTGEFTDINLLVDWAQITGLKVIQLLPINDTTANHNAQDSYPYAAISAFALNPLYINLSKVAGPPASNLMKPYKDKQKALNALPNLDYEEVMVCKQALLKELYSSQKKDIIKDEKYNQFIKDNEEWLKPYAIFCFLRDKNQTADFTKWKEFNNINSEDIEKLLLSKNADQIKFNYYVQYHLHLQLSEVVEYAHKNHIILKGDIPIGVFRNGCDAWQHPDLFNMNEQSGAPPDDFAIKGQNWGFPTYNWQNMQKDGFKWWKARFRQMNHYFDAFRIDHILGFFRIWSIPLEAEEGILGRFMPAIGVDRSEFEGQGIYFEKSRFCDPYITDSILNDVFGEEAMFVKNQFLDSAENGIYRLKSFVNTQRKVAKYFSEIDHSSHLILRKGMFDLITNVICIPDHDNEDKFHFRIGISSTSSFNQLDAATKSKIDALYVNYFYRRQDELWRLEAMHKLPALKDGTDMLICGEDLGMVPGCVPDVMRQLGILSLEIQRMPKDPTTEFFHPKNAPYLSVVTPSTHDMSTIRGWWEEDREKTQRFYHFILGHYGQAPIYCEPWINKEIIIQHLYSPAMWSIFQLQDLMGMNRELRRTDPNEERINVPADPKHYWRYRMHVYLEDLLKNKDFNSELKEAVEKSGRS
ncbi:MAG: 4-alpha-glucanotransferase [Ginsengibacter sp.]